MKELIDLVIEKLKGYGTSQQPLTVGLFRTILEDVKQELEKQERLKKLPSQYEKANFKQHG